MTLMQILCEALSRLCVHTHACACKRLLGDDGPLKITIYHVTWLVITIRQYSFYVYLLYDSFSLTHMDTLLTQTTHH